MVTDFPKRYDEAITEASPIFQTGSGETLSMRLIRPDDADLLIDFARRLSPESRRRRFHQSVEHFSESMIRQLAARLANVDNKTAGGAVLALTEKRDGEPQIVGVARLGREPGKADDPTADAAIVVQDEYQRQGVGTELLRRLVLLARQMGVQQMVAMIEPDNGKAIRLFRALDLPTETETSPGEMTLTIAMPG